VLEPLLQNLKAVGRYGIGVDNIDVPAATEKGIVVINVPSYCEGEVSDHALAMLLAWVRKIPHYAVEVRKGIWDWKTDQYAGSTGRCWDFWVSERSPDA
ncbi:MAG TPA: hypothetical protein ENF15_00850, partial [Candidatus Acetothermia bacterium]|nr:hypothetical protein [Candidatus Acetothermia bacterium]